MKDNVSFKSWHMDKTELGGMKSWMSKWRKKLEVGTVQFALMPSIFLGLRYNMSFSRIQKSETLLIRLQGQSRELPRASTAEPRFEAQFYACLTTESLSLILSMYTTKLWESLLSKITWTPLIFTSLAQNTCLETD